MEVGGILVKEHSILSARGKGDMMNKKEKTASTSTNSSSRRDKKREEKPQSDEVRKEMKESRQQAYCGPCPIARF